MTNHEALARCSGHIAPWPLRSQPVWLEERAAHHQDSIASAIRSQHPRVLPVRCQDMPRHMMFGGLTSLWKIFGRRPCLERSMMQNPCQGPRAVVTFCGLHPSVKNESPPATSAVYDSTSALGSPRSGLTSRASHAQRILSNFHTFLEASNGV